MFHVSIGKYKNQTEGRDFTLAIFSSELFHEVTNFIDRNAVQFLVRLNKNRTRAPQHCNKLYPENLQIRQSKYALSTRTIKYASVP